MTEPITVLADTALGPTGPRVSEHDYAWSLEDDGVESEEFDGDHTTLWLWFYVVTIAVAVAVLAGILVFVIHERHGSPLAPVPQTSNLPAPPPVAAPPNHHVAARLVVPKPPVLSTAPVPSPTVTIEASPPVQREVPPPPPVPELPAPVPVFDDSRDQWLLNNLRSLGYTILNPSLVIANAHEACRLLQQGESTDQMNQQMQARMGANLTDTLQLTSSAMLAYPDCY
jgi:hypothetical protein